MNDPQEPLKRAAELARLGWTTGEIERFAPELESILQAFEGLAELDVEGVEPTCGATLLEDIKREDVPRPSEFAKAIRAAAPENRDDCFRVPRAIDTPGPADSPSTAGNHAPDDAGPSSARKPE